MRALIGCFVLVSAPMLFCAHPSLALPESPVAYAVPLRGIQIDGDLADWPADMIQYPIRHHGQFYGPTDIDDTNLDSSADLSPSFMVGFDPTEYLLYLAVKVRDDRLRVGGSHHKQTDACEVYVDGDHSGESRSYWFDDTASELAALQYVGIPGEGTYGYPDHKGNPSLFLGDIKRTRFAYTRRADTTIYEWAIEVFDHYPDALTHLVPGKTIGFDIAIVDKDTDNDIPAWVCWGPFGGSKYLNADLLGNLSMVDAGTDVHTLPSGSGSAQTEVSQVGWLDPTWAFRAGVGALLAFSLLHLFLFMFYPRLRANLYFAVFTCCSAALLYFNYQMDFVAADQAEQFFCKKAFVLAAVLALVSGLRFLYTLFCPLLPIQFWGFLALALVLGAWSWNTGIDGGAIFALVTIPEMLRVILIAVAKKKKEAWIISAGFIAFLLTGIHQLMVGLNILRSPVEYTYVYGFLGLLASVSVSLARHIARANRHLEEQVVEIRRLSEQALEQERRIRDEELEIKLLAGELQTAHDLQMGLMPKSPPHIPGLDIAGQCLPANHVGGDFFQYFQQGGTLSLCLADVTGHAMEAAVPGLMFSGVLKSQIELGEPLELLFQRLNRTLHTTLDARTFVCLTMGALDPATRILRLANAGCPYPYHYRAATGQVVEVQLDAYPLGVRPDTTYRGAEVQLEPGDRVVFCSDGIIEATNGVGEMFGFARTAETIRRECAEDLSAEDLLARIIQEVKTFSGEVPQGDDQTVVVLKVDDRRST